MRVPEITQREDLPEDQREFYDFIIASRRGSALRIIFCFMLPTWRRGPRT